MKQIAHHRVSPPGNLLHSRHNQLHNLQMIHQVNRPANPQINLLTDRLENHLVNRLIYPHANLQVIHQSNLQASRPMNPAQVQAHNRQAILLLNRQVTHLFNRLGRLCNLLGYHQANQRASRPMNPLISRRHNLPQHRLDTPPQGRAPFQHINLLGNRLVNLQHSLR